MRRRRGFSLVELSVAVGIGILVLAAMYGALVLLGRTEQATDRRATRSITTALLMDRLLNDLRSAAGAPAKAGDSGYRFERWVHERGPLVKKEVVYRTLTAVTIVREVAGVAQQRFSFEGALELDETAVKIRLEKDPDVQFVR